MRHNMSQRRASELAVLLMDGWLARFRGPGWGKKKTKQERVRLILAVHSIEMLILSRFGASIGKSISCCDLL